MDPEEFTSHNSRGESNGSGAEPAGVLRAYLLKDAVFQDLVQFKAKVSNIATPVMARLSR